MMFGLLTLLMLIAVSSAFFGLATKYGRSPFLYVFISVIVFIGSALVLDVFIMSVFNVGLGVIIFASYPIGLLGALLLFSYLRKSWSKEKPVQKTGALDDGFADDEPQ